MAPSVAVASLGMGKAALRNLAFSLHEELRSYGIRVGTVTILGEVQPGTPFDPGKIAEAFGACTRPRETCWSRDSVFGGNVNVRSLDWCGTAPKTRTFASGSWRPPARHGQ